MIFKNQSNYYVIVFIDLVDDYCLAFCIDDYLNSDLPEKFTYSKIKLEDKRTSKFFLNSNNKTGLKYFFSEDGIDSILYSGRKNFINDKLRLLLEFKNPTIIEFPSIISEYWVTCKSCFDSWEEIGYKSFEMCQCPNCKKIYLNPF